MLQNENTTAGPPVPEPWPSIDAESSVTMGINYGGAQHRHRGPSPSTMVFTIAHGTSEHIIKASPFRELDRVSHTMETICLLKFWNFITYKTGATSTTHNLIAQVPNKLGGRGETVHMVNAITWVAHLQRCQNAGWYDVYFDIQEREAGAAEPEVILVYTDEIKEMGRGQRRKTKETQGSVGRSDGMVHDWVFMFLMLVVAVFVGSIIGHGAASQSPQGNGSGRQ